MSTPPPAAPEPLDHARRGWRMLAIMVVIGGAAVIVTGVLGAWGYAPVVGWIAAALTFCAITWTDTYDRDAAQTAAVARREDPSPSATDVLILLANVASLVAVGYLLVQARSAHGARQALLAGLAVASVATSWLLIHTLYMLRYAVLYYSRSVGGINFNQQDLPRFTDFAYLAFTIGMTYQVSDTNLESTQIRAAAFRHGLLSFIFGSMILATMINLIAGLPG